MNSNNPQTKNNLIIKAEASLSLFHLFDPSLLSGLQVQIGTRTWSRRQKKKKKDIFYFFRYLTIFL